MKPKVVLFALLLAPVLAFAQDSKKYAVDDDDGPIEIVGEVQKPEVAVFISRQNLNKQYELELKESFLPKIVDAVEHDPF